MRSLEVCHGASHGGQMAQKRFHLASLLPDRASPSRSEIKAPRDRNCAVGDQSCASPPSRVAPARSARASRARQAAGRLLAFGVNLLTQLSFRPLQPVGHVHLTVLLRSCEAEVLQRLLAPVHSPIELAEAQVAVRSERTHTAGLGKRQRLAVVAFSILGATCRSGVTARGRERRPHIPEPPTTG
jgi:hypothetical protein